ncbi:MAG TPA: CHAP domain-containing protein [Longimicrobium sp.]|jgi:surface antigen
MQHIRKVVPLAVLTLGILGACSDEGRSPIAPEGLEPAAVYTPPTEPVDGEFIRQQGTPTVFLSYGRVLYGIPDPQTLRACTGGRDRVVREVNALPPWTQRTLPSAGVETRRPHGRVWMFGDQPVKTSTSGTVWVIVGCVKSGIPDQATYNTMFGGDWGRIVTVADADLAALPTGPAAQPFPLRRAGTLLEAGGTVKWVTFHGGSLGLAEATTMDSHCREWSEMTSNSTDYNVYAVKGILQPGSYSCVRGDDYPYKSVSAYPSSAYDLAWRYYYRQCTSFAAFRLNQDGTEFHNMYRNRHFGHAYMWADTARAAGLTVNTVAKPGAIAHWNAAPSNNYFSHVAYVAAVHGGGYITIEEYNYAAEAYTSRKILASTVNNFIHFR